MRFQLKLQLFYPLGEELTDTIANAELTYGGAFFSWKKAPTAIRIDHLYNPNNGSPYTAIFVTWNKRNEEAHWSWLSNKSGHLPLGELEDKTYYTLDELGIEEARI